MSTGDSYFTGQAFVKLHVMTGTLLPSRRVTVTGFVLPVPATKVENQSQRARELAEFAMPRLRTRFPYLTRPGSLWTLFDGVRSLPVFDHVD